MTFVYDAHDFSSKTDIIVSCHSKKLLLDVLSKAHEIAYREYLTSEYEPYKEIVKRKKEQIAEALETIEGLDETMQLCQAHVIKEALRTALNLIHCDYRETFDKYVEAYSAVSCMDFNLPF